MFFVSDFYRNGSLHKTIYSCGGEQLRQYLIAMRRRAALTQRQRAEKLGRERSFIARMELGERRIHLIEFRRYCEGCETVPADEAKEIMLGLDRNAKSADLKVAKEKLHRKS